LYVLQVVENDVDNIAGIKSDLCSVQNSVLWNRNLFLIVVDSLKDSGIRGTLNNGALFLDIEMLGSIANKC
jgi:hypothetical protein